MNYAQRMKSIRIVQLFVLATLVLTLAVATIPAHAQTFTVLDNFAINGPGPAWPGGPLALGRDGDLYGYSYLGGANNTGSIWKTDPSGKVSVVYSFATGTGNDCQNGMTLGTDGNFYGTALKNCTGAGYVFKLTPSGTLTVLHTFTGTPDGSGPGLLVQYADGNFYGVTSKGGRWNYGSVFKITPAGKLTTIYSFSNLYLNIDSPTYGLTVGNDGNFYGTFYDGNLPGGVFKITPAGKLTEIYEFTGAADGSAPTGGLILGKDGNFYGATEFGGIFDGYAGYGTIFKITPSGKGTVLYSFSSTDYAAHPTAPLVQATDGNFYGVISGCAEFGCGGRNDIFKITPSGILTVLQEFTGANGSYPYSPLIQDTNGTLYGVAQQGGPVNGGVLFSEDIGAAPFCSLQSTSGKEGAQVGILGQGFSSSSVVKFGGTAASTIVLTGTTFITATVPAGALTGSVTVTTGSTTLTGRQTFNVLPTIIGFTPPSGPVGTAVTITGTGLTQTKLVKFGTDKATSVVVNSDTQVTATVPAGAITATIRITTKGGSVVSEAKFTVN
jgi:uncharacterized repeat protein (TIGR03803 family)